jgi:hypothetical protein
MLLLSETLSSLWDLNSLLSLLNAACKEAANINFSSLWFESTGDQTHNLPYSMQDWGSNPQSTVLNARLGIKPTIYCTQRKIGDQTHNLLYSTQDWGSNPQSIVLNTRLGIKPTIYCTQHKTGDQTHNLLYSMQDWGSNPQSTVLNARLGIKPTIYRTQCKIGDQTHNLPYSMQDWGSNPQSTVLNASILTIIPSMQFALLTEIMKTILNKKDQWMFIINLTTSYTEVKLIYPRK